MTRQKSIESAFAAVNARNASKDASATPSLTTATSSMETSSEPVDGSERIESHALGNGPLRGSVDSDEEFGRPDLHSSKRRRLRADRQNSVDHTKTLLVGSEDGSREQLLQQSVQALDEDWDIGAMPGDNIKIPGEDDGGVKKRRSPRVNLLEQATTVAEKTTSGLGKRGREAMESGIEKIQGLKGSRKRPNKRPRDGEEASSLEEPKKRARFSSTSYKEPLGTTPKSILSGSKKRAKHWVSQGLYVGQSSDFDPRLTETKNKLKKAPTKLSTNKKPAVMPMPIFAGERTLAFGRDFKLPFDVFSPLPPGQPKPDEWKKTHKNVFIGDAADLWKKAKPMEHSLCVCKKEDGCGEHCFNRFMLYECDDNNCNIGTENCTNRAFADLKARCKQGGKYNIGVEVMKTADRGYGVRANRTFEPNQIIIEYTGEIITQDECDHRMNTRYKDAECYYLMDFDQSMVLDATRGSIARFVNHSCAPNCRMVKWTVSGKPRMALFAGDDGIMTGEELTYDYNFDPFSAKNVQECRCGVETCRGVLGPKPKEIKEALKPITSSKKRNIQQVVEGAVETITKRRKLAVPASVRTAFESAKTKTSRKLSQARILKPASTPKESLATKASERVSIKRKSTIGLPRVEQNAPPTKSKARRRSTGNILPRGWKGWALVETPPDTPAEEKPPAEVGGSKWESLETNPANEENVVRTVRRSNRGTTGKSIRVITLGGDELKDWR
ncbi:hypothetical protein ACLMJK_009039 [Lecanora helva]